MQSSHSRTCHPSLLAVAAAALLSSCAEDSGVQADEPPTSTAVVRVLATDDAIAAEPGAPLAAVVCMTLTDEQAKAFESPPLPWDGSYDQYAGPLIESPPSWGEYKGIGVSEEDGVRELRLVVDLTERSAVRALADYASEVGFRDATIEVRAAHEPVGLGGLPAHGSHGLRSAEEHFGL